jgi:hypothetical protein
MDGAAILIFLDGESTTRVFVSYTVALLLAFHSQRTVVYVVLISFSRARSLVHSHRRSTPPVLFSCHVFGRTAPRPAVRRTLVVQFHFIPFRSIQSSLSHHSHPLAAAVKVVDRLGLEVRVIDEELAEVPPLSARGAHSHLLHLLLVLHPSSPRSCPPSSSRPTRLLEQHEDVTVAAGGRRRAVIRNHPRRPRGKA